MSQWRVSKRRAMKMLLVAVILVPLLLLLRTALPSMSLTAWNHQRALRHPLSPQQNAVLSRTRSLSLSQKQPENPWRFTQLDGMKTDTWPEAAWQSGTNMKSIQATHTVHYLWCGQKKFQFAHYLGVLSVVRVLQPLALVFHYTHMPVTDSYHTWFDDLKNSVSGLILRQVDRPAACGSQELLQSMLDVLSPAGGVYVGEGLILTRFPSLPDPKSALWFAFADPPHDLTRGIVLSLTGLDFTTMAAVINSINSTKPLCVSPSSYNLDPSSSSCVKVGESPLNPRDIWAARTEFAELSRWLFYGNHRPRIVKNGTGEAIPRISHYVWLNMGEYLFREMRFEHFLSVLSALYVGGFQQVWIHGNAKPSGVWWERLKGENVTFLPLELPKTVYQQQMTVPAHISDVLRLLILQKFGGTYQDFDVLWSSRVPDWLLTYPAVVCPDWVPHESWPETFNQGVMMARRRSAYLQHMLESFKANYNDKDWFYNGVMMPNKVLEMHPDTVFVYRHLQVLCCFGKCHPPWDPEYIRTYEDTRPILPFHWSEGLSVHVTCPDPNPTLVSPQSMAKARTVEVEVARYVLKKSGRSPQGLRDR